MDNAMQNISGEVTQKLINNNLSITFMESCTSGLLASMFTDTQGASAVFKGSYVTYSNEAKIACGVDSSIIDTYGVYSKECARAMAGAVKKAFGADIAVGITGSTGNIDPNNADSVQGEAFYCIIIGEDIYDYHINSDVSTMSRQEIKQMYANEVYKSLSFMI